MQEVITYNCDQINSRRLFIPDLRDYLKEESSYLHFVQGALLCFCRRGEVTVQINFTNYHLQANEVVAILPTHVFTLLECSDDLMLEALLYADEFWAYIARSVDYRLIRMVELSPSLPLPEEMQAEVYALLEGVKKHEGVLFSDEAEASPRLNSEIEESVAGGLAYALLMLLISLVDRLKVDAPHPVTRKEVLTHDFFELLAKHYVTERQVTFYASKLCVTPKHLSTMVKQVTHAPIQEWINSVTLLHIKRRLLTGTETIQQISEDLNFQTPSTFVRYFRQHTGVTPSKYRNNQ